VANDTEKSAEREEERAPEPDKLQTAPQGADPEAEVGSEPEAAPEAEAGEPAEPAGAAGETGETGDAGEQVITGRADEEADEAPAEEAAAAARAGLALRPADTELLNLFGAASAAAGQLEPAIAALRKATEIAPTDERQYLDLAALCLEHDALDLALEVVNTGLANVPRSAKLYTMRGAIRAERVEVDEAMSDFEQASMLSPDELYGSVGLSLALRQADRLPEAIALLRGKLAAHPRDATLNCLLSDALLRTDPGPTSAEALAALQRALQAKPDFAKAHAAIGKLHLRAGEAAKAVDELRAALKLDPNDRLALNQLVLAYGRLGRREEAAAVVGQLRKLLEAGRTEEVARYRVRLYRAP
jgi:Flp pilus assembly protein TadD